MAGKLTDYALQTSDLKIQGVVEVFVKDVPILQELNFIDLGDAMGLEYDREASLGGIGFRALNGEYAAAAKTVGIINRLAEGTAIMGGEVPVDRQFAGNDAYKSSRIAMKVKAAGKFFARQFVEGDVDADPNGFDGLYVRIVNDNLKWAGANGGYLDLETLSEIIDRVPGEAAQKRLLMGTAMRRNLGKVIRAHGATRMGQAEWEGEHKPKSFDDVPIRLMGEDESGNEIMAFDETRGASSKTGSILCVRLGDEVDRNHCQGIARGAEEYGAFEIDDSNTGDTTTQHKTLVEGRVGLALFHPRCATRYGGIKEGTG